MNVEKLIEELEQERLRYSKKFAEAIRSRNDHMADLCAARAVQLEYAIAVVKRHAEEVHE